VTLSGRNKLVVLGVLALGTWWLLRRSGSAGMALSGGGGVSGLTGYGLNGKTAADPVKTPQPSTLAKLTSAADTFNRTFGTSTAGFRAESGYSTGMAPNYGGGWSIGSALGVGTGNLGADILNVLTSPIRLGGWLLDTVFGNPVTKALAKGAAAVPLPQAQAGALLQRSGETGGGILSALGNFFRTRTVEERIADYEAEFDFDRAMALELGVDWDGGGRSFSMTDPSFLPFGSFTVSNQQWLDSFYLSPPLSGPILKEFSMTDPSFLPSAGGGVNQSPVPLLSPSTMRGGGMLPEYHWIYQE
jgi:hypothetical protein